LRTVHQNRIERPERARSRRHSDQALSPFGRLG
jgi:hypothetical protein